MCLADLRIKNVCVSVIEGQSHKRKRNFSMEIWDMYHLPVAFKSTQKQVFSPNNRLHIMVHTNNIRDLPCGAIKPWEENLSLCLAALELQVSPIY